MPTLVSHFDYELPEKLIAQHSVEPRDHSRLMVVDRETGAWQHKWFFHILDELRAGDVLVMNNTKVFRARLEAVIESSSLRAKRSNPSDSRRIASRKATWDVKAQALYVPWSPRDFTSSIDDELPPFNDTTKKIELFLLRPRDGAWEALVKPGRHVHVGDTIRLGDLEGKVISKSDVVTINFVQSDTIVLAYAQEHGQIPIPPYVHELPEKFEQYQTVYARETGSVAAPTAGFHFTIELLEKIRAKGVEIHYITLHVGLGTFRPMKSETLEEHEMHSEFVTINSSTAIAINQAKQEGRRVIAVGTTTVRALEGVASALVTKVRIYEKMSPCWLPPEGFSGDVNLFITPGFDFRVVDALITNFHLPKSTLLVLVSAFAEREHILAAYHEAIRKCYRFFSFGDAMIIASQSE